MPVGPSHYFTSSSTPLTNTHIWSVQDHIWTVLNTAVLEKMPNPEDKNSKTIRILWNNINRLLLEESPVNKLNVSRTSLHSSPKTEESTSSMGLKVALSTTEPAVKKSSW